MVSLSTPVLSSVTTWLGLVGKLPEWITKNHDRICYDAEISQVELYIQHRDKVQHLRLHPGYELIEALNYEVASETISEHVEKWKTPINHANCLKTLNYQALYAELDGMEVCYPGSRLSRSLETLPTLCFHRRIQVIWDRPLFDSEFWDVVSPSFIQMSEDTSDEEAVDGGTF